MDRKWVKTDTFEKNREEIRVSNDTYGKVQRPNAKRPELCFHTSGRSGLHMVRLGGFEPPTAWFVARYSIQLSYSR